MKNKKRSTHFSSLCRGGTGVAMKHLIAYIVCFALLVNVKCYSFNDVSDSNLTEALNILTELSIINGYSDGTFKPDNNITRAEFSKIIITTILSENILYIISSHFSDVPSKHWAKDYIYISKSLGIVNGITPTAFEPESNITYEQAIKMIVVGLGYEKEAEQKGGYPNGYISVANSLRLISGIEFNNTDIATRRNIALIINKALNTPFYRLSLKGMTVTAEKSEFTLLELHNGTGKNDVLPRVTDDFVMDETPTQSEEETGQDNIQHEDEEVINEDEEVINEDEEDT